MSQRGSALRQSRSKAALPSLRARGARQPKPGEDRLGLRNDALDEYARGLDVVDQVDRFAGKDDARRDVILSNRLLVAGDFPF